MKQNSIVVLIFLLILTNSNVFSQEKLAKPITFADAFEQMHLNSHVLKQAGFAIREKEADKKAAFGLRAPRIFITATAVQMADPITLDLTPVRDAINPLYEALGKYGNFSGVSKSRSEHFRSDANFAR